MQCSYPFIFEKTGPYNVHDLALNIDSLMTQILFWGERGKFLALENIR